MMARVRYSKNEKPVICNIPKGFLFKKISLLFNNKLYISKESNCKNKGDRSIHQVACTFRSDDTLLSPNSLCAKNV